MWTAEQLYQNTTTVRQRWTDMTEAEEISVLPIVDADIFTRVKQETTSFDYPDLASYLKILQDTAEALRETGNKVCLAPANDLHYCHDLQSLRQWAEQCPGEELIDYHNDIVLALTAELILDFVIDSVQSEEQFFFFLALATEFLSEEIRPLLGEHSHLSSASIDIDGEELVNDVCLVDIDFFDPAKIDHDELDSDQEIMALNMAALCLAHNGAITLRTANDADRTEVYGWMIVNEEIVRLSRGKLFDGHCRDNQGNIVAPEANTDYLGPDEDEIIDLGL